MTQNEVIIGERKSIMGESAYCPYLVIGDRMVAGECFSDKTMIDIFISQIYDITIKYQWEYMRPGFLFAVHYHFIETNISNANITLSFFTKDYGKIECNLQKIVWGYKGGRNVQPCALLLEEGQTKAPMLYDYGGLVGNFKDDGTFIYTADFERRCAK